MCKGPVGQYANYTDEGMERANDSQSVKCFYCLLARVDPLTPFDDTQAKGRLSGGQRASPCTGWRGVSMVTALAEEGHGVEMRKRAVTANELSKGFLKALQDEKSTDFDEITSFLGDYGLFQILIIVLLSLSAVPCGYMGVLVVFVADTPEYHCKAPINSPRNGTDVEAPFHERSSWIGPDSCSRYKRDTGNWTAGLSNDTEKCLDGWVFSTEIYTSTIVSEWDLVCDNAWKVPFSTSMFFVGVLFGSFISGHLSDRIGRKPVFFVTMALQTVSALIQATSVNWAMFCVINCLRGLGQISNYLASLILGSEMLSQSSRLSYTLLGHCLGFGIGYALLPLFAYFIRDWRMLLVATAVPGFLFIPTWWLIPESPRWLFQKGRVEEAELVIRHAAKRNRVPAPEVLFRSGECLELMQHKGGNERTYTYMDLIRTPNMRNITVLGVFIWMSVAMVFYGLSLNTSNLNGNVYLNCFISAAIDIATYVASWLLVNRAPRPTLLFTTLMFCGIMLLIIMLVLEDMQFMIQVLALVGKIGVSAAYCLIYVFFTELMPTVVRNMGLGVTSTAARIGTIICPYMIYIGVYNKVLPYIIFGTISIMAAVISLLLPDTRNNKLPDLISQVKPIRGCCSPKETSTTQSDTTGRCKEITKSTHS
ncbi:organic cation/carnitine transporter 2-like [Scomber japonicus]|uniref:organic cation/carnitine transporter 2-like n=1 Tax=Scomber japonicus TaxID=13676 RepID=UPI002305A034|nr:organic cation/carnitine transporter 2-like [Scomber japonicus]